MRKAILGGITLLLIGAGVGVGWVAARWVAVPGQPDSSRPGDSALTESEIWPANRELLAYLGGRPLEVPASAVVFQPFQGFDPDPGFQERARLREEEVRAWRSAGVIDKGAISELKPGSSTIAAPGEPWSTVISFRYQFGKGRVVTGAVLHKMAGKERVFLGFKVLNVE